MSSSARFGRVIRTTRTSDEVLVFGEAGRAPTPVPGALATAAEVLAAAEQQAAELLAETRSRAEAEARRLVGEAEATAAQVRSEAYNEGFAAGHAAGLAEFEEQLALVRSFANEGKAIRDALAEKSAAIVARAVSIATRRIVGEYYEADPERTAAACADALRAAAGEEIVSLRVNPSVADGVRATLVDAARYVRPDDAIEVGGCILDLRHGTLDATLDTRLSLLDAALTEAGGEVSQ